MRSDLPSLLIAAHGTRSPAGRRSTSRLFSAVERARPDVRVTVGYLDVQEPSFASALANATGEVVVVPALLSTGYHVRRDIPGVIGNRSDVRLARHLGPSPLIARALAQRLRAVGGAAPVTLVAAPSSDPSARSEVVSAAELLGTALGVAVDVVILGPDASVASGDIATYLLAEGAFYEQVLALAPRAVSEPLSDHPAVVDLIWQRYDEALTDRAG